MQIGRYHSLYEMQGMIRTSDQVAHLLSAGDPNANRSRQTQKLFLLDKNHINTS